MKRLCRHYNLIKAKIKLKPQKKLFLKDVGQLLETSRKTFNPFYITGIFLYLIDTLEKQKCYDFLERNRKRPVA